MSLGHACLPLVFAPRSELALEKIALVIEETLDVIVGIALPFGPWDTDLVIASGALVEKTVEVQSPLPGHEPEAEEIAMDTPPRLDLEVLAHPRLIPKLDFPPVSPVPCPVTAIRIPAPRIFSTPRQVH